MQWWNDIVDWLSSDDGWRIVSGAIIPFVAIVLAGVIGAGIGRSGVKRLVEQREFETRVAAVAALVSAGGVTYIGAIWYFGIVKIQEIKNLLNKRKNKDETYPVGDAAD